MIPSTLIATPKLTCCAPYLASVEPVGTDNPSSMGFLYKYADLGPLSPCDPATKTGTPPTFESLGSSMIDNSATPSTAFNLTPDGASYTCKSVPGGPTKGELSWSAATKRLTVKGTIFIDGSATAFGTGVPTYDGQATLVLTGTFMMKNAKLCAVVTGGDCNVAAGAWDPNTKSLGIVAYGDGVGGGVQSQTGEVAAGEGIHLKGSSFQGALIANKNVQEETSCAVQGPMVSVYHEVRGGQTCALTFPAINFAPTGEDYIASGVPKGQLLAPQDFGG